MQNNIYIEIIASALATLFFALMRRTPYRVLYVVAPLGALGWAVYRLLESKSDILAYFTAALVIGISAEIFARVKKAPSTVILICAIIPLVPGVMFYSTMMFFVQGQTDQAITAGVNTLIAAGCLVFAVIVSTLLGKHIINPIMKRLIKKVER